MRLEAGKDIRASTPPKSIPARREVLRQLVRNGRAAEALALLESSPLRGVENPTLVEIRIQTLINLRRLADARQIFADALNLASGFGHLNCLMDFAAALYEGPSLTSMWTRLLELTDAAIGRRRKVVTDWLVLKARINLALGDEAGFLAILQSVDPRQKLGAYDRLLRSAAAAMAEPTYPDFNSPKVFGVGLSKTGTTTLAAALTRLGVSTIHWRNPLTRTLISDCDLIKFDGFTDITVAECFEELYSRFPNSKFVYTKRPPESWLASMEEHWRRMHGTCDFRAIKQTMQENDVYWYGSRFRALNNALYFRHESFAEAYRAHDRRVRFFFEDKPKSRLLEFDVSAGDGWGKLCPFLRLPVPKGSFPWKNNTSNLRPA